MKGGPPDNICLKDFTSNQICSRVNCTLIQLTHARDITGGMFTLNKYVKKFKDLEWINPDVCKISAEACPGPFDGKEL